MLDKVLRIAELVLDVNAIIGNPKEYSGIVIKHLYVTISCSFKNAELINATLTSV